MSNTPNTNASGAGITIAPAFKEDNGPKPLTPQQVGMMMMSLQRIHQLAGSQIRTPEMDAEQKQLVQALGNRLIQHSEEFLNAWFTVQREYAPLVAGFTALMARVKGGEASE